LAVLGVCMPSYGAINTGHYVLVYKVSMKAAKTLFDVNDINSLKSESVAGYLAVDINGPDSETIDSNAVFYNAKNKEYRVIPDGVAGGGVGMGPHDPCKAVLLYFSATDSDGSIYMDMVGIGKATQIYTTDKADANTLVKKYVPATFKGASTLYGFDVIAPDSTETGTMTTVITLDAAKTKIYNSAGNNVDEIINAIITDLTKKDPNGWTKYPFVSD
jgi:hypothetical protein